jgi:hypothetical protein
MEESPMVSKMMKTDQHLIEVLRSAAKKGPTAEEVSKQRVSFVYGSLDSDSKNHVTKERIARAFAKQEGDR